ncbi:MAG: hypothetical protein HYZ29_36360 [Myxococcales bacterium]|nr:hypothetical protein [Myxococcales bacterium]
MTDTTEANAAQAAKKLGRPRKADPQRVDYHQLDTLLVMGEMRVDAERGPVTEYPSYRELAKRFGISHSLVAAYSSRHNCLRRREAASEKIRKVTDEKVIARRGTALAEAKERILAIIDRFLEEFGKALEEGRVRVDSVADLNIMVRLREFLQGGPDSRQEVRGMPSLEELSRRYAEAQRREREEGPNAGGVVHRDREPASRERALLAEPPVAAFANGSAELHGHIEDDVDADDEVALDDGDDRDTDTAASD